MLPHLTLAKTPFQRSRVHSKWAHDREDDQGFLCDLAFPYLLGLKGLDSEARGKLETQNLYFALFRALHHGPQGVALGILAFQAGALGLSLWTSLLIAPRDTPVVLRSSPSRLLQNEPIEDSRRDRLHSLLPIHERLVTSVLTFLLFC